MTDSQRLNPTSDTLEIHAESRVSECSPRLENATRRAGISRLTGNDAVSGRLSRHTALLLLSNIVGGGLLFSLSVLIGRSLGPDGLGVYSVVLAWLFPLSLLVDFGLSTLATREVARSPEQAGHLLAQMSAARLVIGGVCALAVAVAAPLLSNEPAVIVGLRLSAPMVIIMPLYSSYTAVFRGLGAMWPVPWLNIGMLAAQVGLSLWILTHAGGVTDLLLVNMLTSAGQLVAAWTLWRRSFRHVSRPVRLPVHMGVLSASLRRAWPFAVAALLAALQVRVSVILLEWLANVDEVAYFAAASRFTEAARLVPNAIFGALFPLLAALAATPGSLARTLRRAYGLLAVYGLVVIAGAWLAGGLAVQLTFGDAFSAAAPTLHLLAVALLFSGLRGAVTLALYARDAEGRANTINGAMLAGQVVVSVWLISALGAAGAALALVICEALALAWLARALRVLR